MTQSAPPNQVSPFTPEPKTSPLATWGLVSSLVVCLWPLSSIAGLIFGITALPLIAKSQGRLGGRGAAITAIIVGLIGTILMPIAIFTAFVPTVNRMIEETRMSEDRMYLSQIGYALSAYSADHNGKMPTHPAALGQYGWGQMFASPLDTANRFAPGAVSVPESDADAESTVAYGGYFFFTGQVVIPRVSNSGALVIAMTRRIHDTQLGRNVLYLDMHVEYVTEEEVAALIEQQNKLRETMKMPEIDTSVLDLRR